MKTFEVKKQNKVLKVLNRESWYLINKDQKPEYLSAFAFKLVSINTPK